MMSAEIGPETNIYPQLATQLVSAIAPAIESACSPREHDISTRELLLHIRKLNLIASE